ncbi:MAG: CBO0543 family protein [Syntrophomonadaceae bacterium]|nr:CBO0543 family protein [Syntrophomonadaceae bacterium]
MQPTASEPISALELQWYLLSIRYEEWRLNDVFHFKWWLLLILFIVSAYVWWKLVDKSRLVEIVLFTGLVSIIALVLDELGEELTLWDYSIDLIPLFPPITSIDLASLPVAYSFIYQYFTTWKKFIIATVVMSAVFSFILEPIFVWGGIYQTITWKYYYGFPIYIALAICVKAMVIKLNTITANSQK